MNKINVGQRTEIRLHRIIMNIQDIINTKKDCIIKSTHFFRKVDVRIVLDVKTLSTVN